MSWTKNWRCLAKIRRSIGEVSKLGPSWNCTAIRDQIGVLNAENIRYHCFKPQKGCLPASLSQKDGIGVGPIDFRENMILSGNALWKSKLPSHVEGISRQLKRCMIPSRQFGHSAENDPHLSRNFLAQLWVADRKVNNSKGKGRFLYENYVGREFSDASAIGEKIYDLPTQPASGFLKPASAEEARVAFLLARSNLLITRDIEWANLVLGFEQENRYAVVDVCYPQAPVGFIREKSNFIARQLLRLRRPFVASIIDGSGNELFRVRRPFWWITSSIYAEVDGKEIGVVHRRWHLWRRVYDLYLGSKQFAVVENPGFWNWTFTLKDIGGEVLAQIDRDWRGFGFEIFTDAGQYVIRFGNVDGSSKTGPAGVIEELEVVHPLTLSERAVAVALAISLDNDYFSRHGGWGVPFFAVGE